MAKTEQANVEQVIDPYVSKKKFQRELGIFNSRKNAQRERGIILLEANFPNMEIMFLAPQLIPSPAVFTARINFSNYDLEPPSVTFIDPFTKELLKANEVLTQFCKKNGVNPQGHVLIQPLLQSENLHGIPFLCIPGVREYHNHPYHTGDTWLLHRKLGGEGSLGYLIDKLYTYGISSLEFFTIHIAANAPRLQLGLNSINIPE